MYRIFLDGELLYDPRVQEYDVSDATVTLAVNTTNECEITLPPSHPLYNHVQKLKSVVDVYQGAHLLFHGRVLNDDIDFQNNKTLICEGALGYFNDSIIRPYSFEGSIEDFIQMLLDAHNAQVDAHKRFELGEVTVTDTNDYIVRANADADNTWKTIEEKLIKLLGGYIICTRVNDVNYLNYYDDSPFRSDQVIEFGENLLDVKRSNRGEDVITALIPYGKKLEDSENRVDIKSVNDGVDYVYSEDAVAAYGWVFGTETWDDVTEPINLIQKAREYLGEQVAVVVDLDVSAFDLSLIDATIDQFRFFEYIQINSQAHGLDDLMLVTKYTLDLLSPANNTLSMSKETRTLTEYILGSQTDVKEVRREVTRVERDTKVLVNNRTETLISEIVQTKESIRTEVAASYVRQGDTATIKDAVSTEFNQLSNEFNFSFSKLNELVQALSGDTQTRFEEIKRYIRFVNGEIIIGEVNSPFTMKLSNERLSFLQNNVEIAYMNNNKLYITQGEFLTNVRVGNYAFVPRSNGNLSFKWVGD